MLSSVLKFTDTVSHCLQLTALAMAADDIKLFVSLRE
jgi:hypothetical protein